MAIDIISTVHLHNRCHTDYSFAALQAHRKFHRANSILSWDLRLPRGQHIAYIRSFKTFSLSSKALLEFLDFDNCSANDLILSSFGLILGFNLLYSSLLVCFGFVEGILHIDLGFNLCLLFLPFKNLCQFRPCNNLSFLVATLPDIGIAHCVNSCCCRWCRP